MVIESKNFLIFYEILYNKLLKTLKGGRIPPGKKALSYWLWDSLDDDIYIKATGGAKDRKCFYRVALQAKKKHSVLVEIRDELFYHGATFIEIVIPLEAHEQAFLTLSEKVEILKKEFFNVYIYSPKNANGNKQNVFMDKKEFNTELQILKDNSKVRIEKIVTLLDGISFSCFIHDFEDEDQLNHKKNYWTLNKFLLVFKKTSQFELSTEFYPTTNFGFDDMGIGKVNFDMNRYLNLIISISTLQYSLTLVIDNFMIDAFDDNVSAASPFINLEGPVPTYIVGSYIRHDSYRVARYGLLIFEKLHPNSVSYSGLPCEYKVPFPDTKTCVFNTNHFFIDRKILDFLFTKRLRIRISSGIRFGIRRVLGSFKTKAIVDIRPDLKFKSW